MIRIILGVVAGFIAWSIIWVGSDQVLINLSKGWYAPHQFEFEKAIYNDAPFSPDNLVMLISLLRSVIASLLSGFLAAFVAGENRKAPMVLGVVLLLVGIAVQAMVWNYQPIWFHISFLLLLIPVTIMGGKLRSSAART